MGDNVITLDDESSGSEIILLDESNVNESFHLDTTQCNEEENEIFMGESTHENGSIISHLTPEQHFASSSLKRSRSSCFNCTGDHPVSQCTEKINRARILRNRSFFLGSKRRESGARFHEEQSSRYLPGFVGPELRDALGIKQMDIPPWVFRMRKKGFIDGYPPGYKARIIEKSTYKFVINEQDKAEDKEDHEYCFDSDKIIRYPGFNYEDKRLKDPEGKVYKIPPWHLVVSAFQKYVDEKNMQAKLGNLVVPLSKNSRLEIPLQYSTPLSSLGKRKTDLISSENDIEHQIDSKKKKKSINDSMDKKSPKNASNRQNETLEEGEILDNDDSDQSKSGSPQGQPPTPSISSNANDEAPSSSTGSKSLDLSQVVYGTPIPIARNISSDKLNHEFMKPPLDKWAQGIQPFQHQEETKDKTGFFKKMKGIIGKVVKGIKN